MTDLRKLAQGRPCQVRIPGCCNGNTETTVLAHFRMSGISGMGIRSHDIFGSYACFACHDAIDGRSKSTFTRDELRLMHLEGVIRTQAILVKEGILTW